MLPRLSRPLRILDVGGTPDFWERSGFWEAFQSAAEITVLNLDRYPADGASRPILTIEGDARRMPEIRDGEFDVVFSNSTIEHVGDLGDQRRMAEEVRRVGRAYFVQTPNASFPIEPHFLFPFFQYLPFELRVRLVETLPLGWRGRRAADRAEAESLVRSIRLLCRDELLDLFPGAAIWEERIAGIAKSFVVHSALAPDGLGFL